MKKSDIEDMINSLFKELSGIFPAFKQAWPTNELVESAKKNWLMAFIEVSITKEMIIYGLRRCRESESSFVVSPGQFIKWCYPKPEYLGFPDAEYAFKLAILLNRGEYVDLSMNERTKQLLLHILHHIGSFEFRRMKEETARIRFFKLYDSYFQKYYKGELNLDDIALEDKSADNHDRPDVIKPEFAHIQSREEAMKAIRAIGIRIKKSP